MVQKHLVENNKMTFYCLLIIHILSIVGGLLYSNHLLLPIYIYLGIAIFGVLITLFGRIKFVNENKGHTIMLIGVAFTYLDIMVNLYEVPLVYALTYVICITIMLYRDKRILIIGLGTAVFANIVLTVMNLVFNENLDLYTIIANNTICVSAMIISYLVVARMNRQTNELNEEIEHES